MVRINYIRQILHFAVYVIIQIPLLYKSVIFNQAFAFFYLGFILFIPFGVSRSFSMILAFFTGLTIDVFSSTPGVHASVCVFIAFVKDYWFLLSIGDPEDEINMGYDNLGIWGLIKYVLPLVFFHHFLLFIIENSGFNVFGPLLMKSLASTLYTATLIISIAFLIVPKAVRQ